MFKTHDFGRVVVLTSFMGSILVAVQLFVVIDNKRYKTRFEDLSELLFPEIRHFDTEI